MVVATYPTSMASSLKNSVVSERHSLDCSKEHGIVLLNEAANDPIPISALQHFSYCPRQCALIHIEQFFDENIFTVRGRILHERVDSGERDWQVRPDGTRVRIERSLPLWSERLGLIGKADVVEFPDEGAPYPVEYKSGRKREKVHDDVQLCAQALCLEEMLNASVPRGAIFHHASRRRREVEFTTSLRAFTMETIERTRTLLTRGVVPPPIDDRRRCRDCSLREACVPEVADEPMQRAVKELWRLE